LLQFREDTGEPYVSAYDINSTTHLLGQGLKPGPITAQASTVTTRLHMHTAAGTQNRKFICDPLIYSTLIQLT